MYFLSEEENRLVLRRLAPQARERGVAEELRGWNWDKPPLSPIFDTRLGVYEVAGHYCPTGRDIYLRRVMKVRVPPSPAMAQGGYDSGGESGHQRLLQRTGPAAPGGLRPPLLRILSVLPQSSLSLFCCGGARPFRPRSVTSHSAGSGVGSPSVARPLAPGRHRHNGG